jgi:hypothetical protein
VTCYTQPCKPYEALHIMHYLPKGDESSPRGRWGICAPALLEVLTYQSAFKSELVGLYAIITLLNSLVDYYEARNGTFKLACDGIQALEYVFDTKKSVTTANNSYDLILAMIKMIANSRITWKRQHVKVHQDIPRDQLDIWGRAIDDCDMDAKAFWEMCR